MQFFEPLVPGNYYHIYNRGINSENLFKQPKNYGYFLQLYQQHVTPFVETYAFNLLGNHFHLMVYIKEKVWINEEWIDNSDVRASKAFSNFFNAYAQGINKVYKRTGGLFETPFKRKLITDQSHYTWLVFYIHTNAQLHGMVADFKLWPSSSYHSYLHNGPSLVCRDKLLNWFGGKEAFIKYHEQINFDNFEDFLLE